MKIAKIPADVVDGARPYVEKFLSDALKKGGDRFSLDEIFDDLRNEEAFLWMAAEDEDPLAAVVVYHNEYASGRGCSIELCGGTHRKKWMSELLSEIEADARNKDCDWVEAIGRPGWARLLTDYKKKALILVKEL